MQVLFQGFKIANELSAISVLVLEERQEHRSPYLLWD